MRVRIGPFQSFPQISSNSRWSLLWRQHCSWPVAKCTWLVQIHTFVLVVWWYVPGLLLGHRCQSWSGRNLYLSLQREWQMVLHCCRLELLGLWPTSQTIYHWRELIYEQVCRLLQRQLVLSLCRIFPQTNPASNPAYLDKYHLRTPE